MRVVTVPLGRLVPYPGNPRRHDLAALAESLQAHGQIRPLVVQRATGVVLAGNGTLQAAHELGWTKIAVYYVDADDAQATRINLVDNRTSDLATYNVEELAAQLHRVDADLTGTGFTMDDLDDLVAQLGAMPETDAPFAGELAPNEERDPPKAPLTSSGLKEVILVLRTEELRAFETRIEALRQLFGTETVTATVLEALQRAEV